MKELELGFKLIGHKGTPYYDDSFPVVNFSFGYVQLCTDVFFITMNLIYVYLIFVRNFVTIIY